MGFRLDGMTEFLKTKYVTTTPHHVGHWPQNTRCWKNADFSLAYLHLHFFSPENQSLFTAILDVQLKSNKAVF